MNLGPGATFERYAIETLLAETRMSHVWVAIDTETGKRVALKTIRKFAENDDLVEAARFGAVMQQMLSERDHRVVSVNRHGNADGHFFIDMEFIEGRDVSEILSERGRIAPGFAVRIALEVAELLNNLSNFNATIDDKQLGAAVHGDLKPKNVRIAGVLEGMFEVKVLDFGTAKALSFSKPGGTRAPAWSPAYASPELLDRQEMNPLSDRWALGAMLYEMAAGRVPFGAGKSIEEMENQIRLRPEVPDLGVEDCPPALHAIIQKLLDPEPERRYQSASELVLDLKNFPEMPKVAGYRGETVRSSVPPSSATAETRRSAGPLRAKPKPEKKAAIPKTPRELLARLIVVLIVAGLAVWWMVREKDALAAAQALETDLAAEKVSADEARARLDELNHLPFVWFRSAKILDSMNRGYIAEGDAILVRFRSGAVRAAEWQTARQLYERAWENDLRSDAIKGRTRLAEAHLKRIEAHGEKNADAIAASASLFEESAKLLPRSPDPWLGIAIIELYNRKDPERAEEALAKARDRSFDFTGENRWVAMLAECYRQRADILATEALKISGTLPDQARDRLERAIDFDQKAIDLFAKIPLYGSSLSNIQQCRSRIDQLRARLEQMKSGYPSWLKRFFHPQATGSWHESYYSIRKT
ncbi:MAG TPA: serine/threonine-protein kinase [Bryobacteraceae bacterium]|nr:serine/threonine-protein kinase [Bryobacteraceae bacterium]